jgi:hypothetical protein
MVFCCGRGICAASYFVVSGEVGVPLVRRRTDCAVHGVRGGAVYDHRGGEP